MSNSYTFGDPGVNIEFGIHSEDYSEYANYTTDDDEQFNRPQEN